MLQEPESLLHDFPRGDPTRPLNDFTPPNATFVDASMMRGQPRVTWKPGKLFLGVVDGAVHYDADGDYNYVLGGLPVGVDDNRHVCTFAGSRAGKGRAAIVPNMLHYPGSVLATDPKGELAAMTARRRKELGQTVHVLDPFGRTAGTYPANNQMLKGFNPVISIRDDHMVEDAALIADAVVISGGKDPHWDESARTFIEGVILHVRTHADYEGKRHLLTVRELVGRGAPDTSDAAKATGYSMNALCVKMGKNDAAEGVIQRAAADFLDRGPNEKGSVLSSARRHLKFIDLFDNPKRPLGRMTLTKHDFELSDLKTGKTTIYLVLPARHIGTCSRWLRLFVNLTLQSMEETRVETLPGRVPVLCVLDEFASLGHMKQIEDAAAQIAGFGVKLWTVLQDIGQLKALYSERWETFLGNAGIVQCFGNNDLTTLEWISKRCGKTSIETLRKSDVTGDGFRSGAKGESTATEIHELLTPDEVARWFGRDDPLLRQLVIWAGRKNPLLVMQRAYYDHHELFRVGGRPGGAKLFDDPP